MANILATGISHKEHLRVFDEVIEARLNQLEIEKVLVYLVDTVDASALFSLATQFDVLGFKGWRLATTEQEQRELIKKAIELHRYKGTPFAIREAVKAVGFFDVDIVEGGGVLHNSTTNYDGSVTYGSTDWAVFRVLIDLGNVKGLTTETLDALVELINEYKNARSTLVETGFRATLSDDADITDSEQITLEYAGFTDLAKREFNYDGVYSYNGERQHDGTFDDIAITVVPNLTSDNVGIWDGRNAKIAAEFLDRVQAAGGTSALNVLEVENELNKFSPDLDFTIQIIQ